MELEDMFQQAIADSKTLPEKPNNSVLLQLYATYKQSTVGDVNVAAPDSPFDFVAKAKYDAWVELKGTSQEVAMQNYIDLVAKLKA